MIRMFNKTDSYKSFIASGFAFLLCHRRGFTSLALLSCLFFMGSCSDNSVFTNWLSKPAEISTLSKTDLDRYARGVQLGVAKNPDQLASLRQQDVELIFSKPHFVRNDGVTQVWQYRTESCVVDIYWQGSNVQNKAKFVEFRDRQLNGEMEANKSAPWHCVQSLVQNRDI